MVKRPRKVLDIEGAAISLIHYIGEWAQSPT